VLLKARAEEAGVASKLIASSADLDAIAGEPAPEVAALSGWRHEVFGRDALRLKRGEIALSASGSTVTVVPLA
jgi:ribonuclease D